jgi:plastocyanin
MTSLKNFRNLAIKLVLILFLLAGVTVLLKAQNSSVIVFVDEQGFEPQKLTVPVGTTVVFKNTGKALHWPASNYHPTHELYPEPGGCIGSKFDACRGLKTGEIFSFLFKVAGSWPVHDHLSPGNTMVIEVTNEAADSVPNQEQIDFSKQGLPKPSQFRALNYTNQLDLIKKASVEDPVNTWQYIKAAFLVNGQVVGNAHEFAHIIGNQVYLKYGLAGIKNCDETFAYGCYHGVTEKLLEQKGPTVVKSVQDECLKIFPTTVSTNYTGCIHGMGHGLLTFRALNIKDALNDCDALDQKYRPYCYDGVFMENAMDNPKTAYDANDPWKLCKNLSEQYQYNCGRYQSQAIRQEFSSDLDKTATACAQAPNDVMKTPCFEGLGFFVAQQAVGDVQKILDLCGTIKNIEGMNNCIIAAAKETIFQKYNNWEQASAQLCERIANNFKDKCIESRDQVKKMYKR